MATAAKKTTAKRTTATKTAAAKKSSTATKTTAAKKTTTAPSTVDAVRESLTSAAREVDETVKQYTAVAGDQVAEVLGLTRGIVDIYVGIPFVLQSRLAAAPGSVGLELDAVKSFVDDVKGRFAASPSVDFDAVKSFLDEAKHEGHARVTAFQGLIEPVASDLTKRVEAAAEKFEAQLPSQLSELLETGRARVRGLVAA